MKWISRPLSKAIRTSPFFGRTLAVLAFIVLPIKQIFIYLAFSEVFKEASAGATLAHYLGYFISDFLICLIIRGLVFINMIIKKTFMKIINNVLMSILFLLFLLDIFTMYFFQSRISIFDMAQFLTPSVGDFSRMILAITIVLLLVAIVIFIIVQNPKFKRQNTFLFTLYFFLFALSCFGVSIYAPGGFRSLPDNIISMNLTAFSQNFSAISSAKLPDTYQKFFGKKRGSNKKTNVIVLFAESLSPIDSLRVGGKNDNLPYFDLIQKQGITYTNFIANGCTSDTAHLGLLLGIEPLKIMGPQMSAYSGYKTYTDTLPQFFTSQGYTTTFVSAVNLEFLDQRPFLSGIGFQTIIGEEAFKGSKKYVFDAAPDIELYAKTMETIKKQRSPYFIVLQSISFHKPYDTPYGKNQKDALRYSDKALFYFYLQLKKSGFFDNGILVIVGDHRKMEPLEEQEKEALGPYRYTRGLATIIGTGITPGTINSNIIQHTDIFYGLRSLVGKGMVTVSKLANDIFSQVKRRDWGIVYCRYFQNNNKYTIVAGSGMGRVFNDLSEISADHKFIHQYLASYISFEQGSGTVTQASKRNMLLIAHQGSPRQVPENSLEGFLLAQQNGADGIEFDVSQTKDHQSVVIHGERTWATVCGQEYVVENHTREELRKKCPLKNGEPLSTLEDMLKSVNGLFDYYFLEIKVTNPADVERQTLDAIQTVQKLGMQDKVIFTSYDKEATYILGSYKHIIAGRDTYNLSDLDTLPNMNHPYYLMPQVLIKETTPQEVEDIGKKLVVYTVNTTGDLEKLYREGVRMVMTDDVPLLRERADNHLGK